MFTDPMSLTPYVSGTFGTAVTLNKTAEGLYLLSTATLDEPHYISVQNTIAPAGTSSFVVKYEATKNVPGTPAYGGKLLDDDRSSVHLVVRQTHRAHTAADIKSFRNVLMGFLLNDNAWDRFLRGEK